MATQQKTSSEVEKCRSLLQGLAKNLADRLYGPQGPPSHTSFDQLVATALAQAEQLRKFLLDLLLARQADAFHRELPADLRVCSSCAGDTLPCEPEARLVHSRAGIVEWLEPQRYCPHCRKAFFPQSKSLGLDQGHYSIDLLDLICYAGANKASFREASLDLAKMAGVAVQEKQVERLSKRIGAERLAEREAQVKKFLALPLVQRCDGKPAGVAPPGEDRVAVIMADAGMIQLRDAPAETAGDTEESAVAADALGIVPSTDAADADAAENDDVDHRPSGRHWREDKVGLLLTMSSAVSTSDPCPEVPDTFLDADRVGKIVRGLKKSTPVRAEDEDQATAADDAVAPETPESAAVPEPDPYQGPKLETRQVVASRKSWPLFGVLLASAAWLAGLAPAKRKAFVADGARAIWRVWQARFSSYVPILDFIHAMSYVYTAAKAMGEDTARSWRLYQEWIRLVWQGKVADVIAVLAQWQQEHGTPAKGETSARAVVARTLGYLKNNQSRMKYDEYRRQGLPIVSSLVESMVKQISRRVKGTEKFWTDSGAEAILQLRADYLSDGGVMEDFWKRRQGAATGQRTYRSHN